MNCFESDFRNVIINPGIARKHNTAIMQPITVKTFSLSLFLLGISTIYYLHKNILALKKRLRQMTQSIRSASAIKNII